MDKAHGYEPCRSPFKSERAYQIWECGRHRERSPKSLSREFESLLPCHCGSEGEVNSQASHKRPVARLSPAAATGDA
jgi:hypothetical protein